MLVMKKGISWNLPYRVGKAGIIIHFADWCSEEVKDLVNFNQLDSNRATEPGSSGPSLVSFLCLHAAFFSCGACPGKRKQELWVGSIAETYASSEGHIQLVIQLNHYTVYWAPSVTRNVDGWGALSLVMVTRLPTPPQHRISTLYTTYKCSDPAKALSPIENDAWISEKTQVARFQLQHWSNKLCNLSGPQFPFL